MRGNIVKRSEAVNAPHQLGKITRNQSLRIGSDIMILADAGTSYDLILLYFFPHMTFAYSCVCPDSAAMKCFSSMVLTPRSRAFCSFDPAFAP